MASFSINSAAVANTGAECANSGKTTSRTGKNGAAPATAESIIDSIRSVFARIALRSIGFGRSVWQQAAEYLMCSIKQFSTYPQITQISQRKKSNGPVEASRLLSDSFPVCVICVICGLSSKYYCVDQRDCRRDHASIVFVEISPTGRGQRILFGPLIRVTAHAMER